jgi:N-acetylglucosamine-6-phosphate deacetylase
MPSNTGYFDLQINGYAGTDFNSDDLSAEALSKSLTALQRDGVAQFLPTIITDTIDVMSSRLSRLSHLRNHDPLAQQMIPGLHIEGPFLNETNGYRGAHPKDAIHPANPDEMQQLLDSTNGLVKLVTLAPERDPNFKTIQLLARNNIKISAGHTDASLDQLNAAIDNGLSLFTHVGNACPMQLHRHDNIINRALSLSDRLYLTFIADGTHIPLFALKNYLMQSSPDHSIIITDAIAPAGLGPGRYKFSRWDLLIEADLVARSPDKSHFVGSAITMRQSESNLSKIGLSSDTITRFTRTNPRLAIGLTS